VGTLIAITALLKTSEADHNLGLLPFDFTSPGHEKQARSHFLAMKS
jgi:hypothetical protein